MEYEIYDIIVLNSKYKTILLDDVDKSGKTYLLDTNKNEYIWFNHEYLSEDVEAKKGQQTEISLKFNKQYKPTLEAQTMIFSNVILDNEKTIKISIEL